MIKIGKFLERELASAGIDMDPMEIKRGCFDFFTGGGSGNQTGSTTTIQSQRPIPVIEDALGTVIPAAEDLLDIPINQPDFDTVVPFSTQTEAALQAQEARALGGSDLERAAQDTILSTARGDLLDRENPFFQDFANTVAGDVGSIINSQFSGSNRLGEQANAQALGRGVSNAIAPLSFRQFENERQNQLAAAELAPNLAQIDFNNINQLGQVGAAREQQQGALLQDQINRFNFSELEPRRRVAEVLALIQGGNIGGSSSTTQPIFSQSGFSQGLGGALGLAGLGNSLFNRNTGLFPNFL